MPRRGTLVSFNSTTYRATVRPDGSGAQALTNLPVSRAIAAIEMVAGRRVALDAGAALDPEDLVVIAVW